MFVSDIYSEVMRVEVDLSFSLGLSFRGGKDEHLLGRMSGHPSLDISESILVGYFRVDPPGLVF